MTPVRWTLSALGFCFCATGASLAHDFTHGALMGLPPKLREAEARLLQLIPAGLDQPTQAAARGIIDRVKMWRQEQELEVCFLSGSRQARARVAATASDWLNFVNLRLNFGDMTDPRPCSGTGREHIKIDFVSTGPDAGYWSYVGVDSWQFAHSMNLSGYGDDALPGDEAEFRGVVLHEFGHALGFAHEHQSPAAHCDAEFDAAQVAAWAASIGWSQAQVDVNLASLQPSTSLEFTRHDTKSIMHYSLPPELFRDGRNNRCWVPKNNELSDGDKEFAARMYPPRVASARNASGEGVRLGAPAAAPEDAAKKEADYRADLQRSFATLLAPAGAEGQALATKFEEEVAKLRDGPGGAAQ